MNQYEAMFLFDPTFASDFAKAREEVQRILHRAEAEIVFLEKWEERKLAYEIKGRKRGCYVLVYFKCASDRITGIERDARLSEPVLRILLTRADGITHEQIERFMPQARTVEGERGESPVPPAGREAEDEKADVDAREAVESAPAAAEAAKDLEPGETPPPSEEPTPSVESAE